MGNTPYSLKRMRITRVGVEECSLPGTRYKIRKGDLLRKIKAWRNLSRPAAFWGIESSSRRRSPTQGVPGLKRLIRFAAAHPWLVLVSLALLTALAAGQLTRVEVNISAEGMLEKGTPAWDHFCQAEGARRTCWRWRIRRC